MKRVMTTFVSAALIFGLGMSGQSYAAKDFPARPIEIVVPYTPGATMDLLARLIGSVAPKYLGQPVVAVSKPGAGGSVAAGDVIGSKPIDISRTSRAAAVPPDTLRPWKMVGRPSFITPPV